MSGVSAQLSEKVRNLKALQILLCIIPVVFPFLVKWTVPGFNWQVAVVFRSDPEYFPFVSALAQGWWSASPIPEFSLLDSTFPLANFAVHGSLFRMFGPLGFFVADGLFFTLLCLAVYQLVKVVIHDRMQAFICAFAAVVIGESVFVSILHWPFPSLLTGRFPRPLVITPVLIGHLAVLLAIQAHGLTRSRCLFLAALSGITFNLSPQLAQLVFLVSVPGIMLSPAVPLRDRCRHLAIWSAVSAIVSLPTLLQLFANGRDADWGRRLGMEPLGCLLSPNPAMESLPGWYRILFLGVVLGVTAYAVRKRVRSGWSEHWRAIVMTTLILLIGLMTVCPLNNLLIRTSIQEYHYKVLAMDYYFPVGLLFMAACIPYFRLPRIATASAVVALCLAMSVRCAQRFQFAQHGIQSHPHGDMYQSDPPGYRHEFTQMVNFLGREQTGRSVLSFDYLPAYYLVNFAGFRSELPHPFLSKTADIDIEDRFLGALKAAGVQSTQLDNILQAVPRDGEIDLFPYLLGHAKYHVNEYYALRPADDYEPYYRDRIPGSGRSTWGTLAIPISEFDRLKRRFEEIPAAKPDVIILHSDGVEGGMTPGQAEYTQIFRSRIFRIFERHHAL